jgi:aspartyl-tRNA(Asn)/glutamyl-tRNA(Gln) amidotransferase subunit A
MLGADDLAGVDADVHGAYLNVIARLREMGVEVREFSIDPPFEAFVDKNGALMSYEGWRTHSRRIEAGRALMDPHVLARFEAGRDVTDEAYAAAVRQRAADQIKMHRQLEGFDAIMTPTTPIVAPPIDEVDEGELPLSRYTRAVNYFGLCALAVPAALDSAGLPISVQFIGRPNDEALLLRLGHAWEREHGRFPVPDLSGFLDR